MPVLTGNDLEEVEASLSNDLRDLVDLVQGPWSKRSLEELRATLKHASDAVDALLDGI